MSDILKEQLSTFMDGELPAEECELLLKRVAASSELAETWYAYHVIGDALRDQLAPAGSAQDLATRVGRALSEDQPSRRHFSMRRLGTVAAGVAVLGLAGLVGGLVSRHIGTGQVFTTGTGAVSPAAGRMQIDWRQAPTPVRTELNRYLLMHDPFGETPQGLGSQNSANSMTAAPASPAAGSAGQGSYRP